MFILLLLIVTVFIIFFVKDIRISLITRPAFKMFKKVLPPLSQTEREAMEAGDIWWDGELFKGTPDWHILHSYPKPTLSDKENAFLNNQVNTLCNMLDDYKIVHEDKDLPEDVWQYLKNEGFFSLIIPESFGGRDFSAIANSTIVSRIATCSLSAAVTVMVPNSLGPGELLIHYGTQQQKDFWLPKLANGSEVPCFALTGPEAGSAAASISDTGIICEGEFAGKTVIGIRLNWSKSYITLAPVASVLGLAFKMFDPDGLFGDKKEIGITCALIPTDHKGVIIGERHNPMAMAFMNGTTYGKDVFIPLDWIIGGPEFCGKGWRMLVECLSAGRGISLPAMATAIGHTCSKMTGAYAYVRKQFGLSIGQFEGIQHSLARIGGFTYSLEAMRTMTAGALDLKLSPSVITAIAKYHMTEMSRKVINDALDIHGGKGIQLGPNNYLGHAYMGMPISITVEGANILTRNLMIFGQGATRCHPYILKEMAAASEPDFDKGLQGFDDLLIKHVLFAITNAGGALGHGLTRAMFSRSPVSGPTAKYYKQLTRMSRSLAICTDITMLTLGSDLKRKEMISARLGDVLSQLYISSAVLKRFEDEGRQQSDLPFVCYSLDHSLYQIGQAFDGLFENFPSRTFAFVLKRLVFPLGNHYKQVPDDVSKSVCFHMLQPGVMRNRLSHLCHEGDAGGMHIMESAFVAMHQCEGLFNNLKQAIKEGKLSSDLTFEDSMKKSLKIGLFTSVQVDGMIKANALRMAAISVDNFKKKEI